MAKLGTPSTAGFNAGRNHPARPVRVADIVIDPEISGIFKIHDKTLAEIRRRIERFGYDKSQPVVVQKGTNILVDGHTRLAAAREAGLEEVPAFEREFGDREEMLMYTFERQAVRRNLTGPEILTAARMIKGPKEKDGKGRAAELLAERLGVGVATVYQARAILKEGTEEEIEAVRNGEKSIKAAYGTVRRKREPVGEPTITLKETHEITSHWEDLETALNGIGLNQTNVAAITERTHDLLRNQKPNATPV